MSSDRSRRWPGVIILILALGGLAWAITRYINHVDEPPQVVEEPAPGPKGKGFGPPSLPPPPPLPSKAKSQ